jgi:hypothetical protein
LSDIPGTHPSVDEGLKTAHYGHGQSSSEAVVASHNMGKGGSAPSTSEPVVEMHGYGEVRSGQKGFPATD